MQENKKGRVCVTGGTGFLGSWMIKRLLEDGYSVNATIRLDPERKRDISFITNLPGAPERLQIFDADLAKPDVDGDQNHYKGIKDSSFVHVDDVARAHIHLFELPEAKGRYIVSAVEFKIEEICEFISAKYPEYKMPSADSWKDVTPIKLSGWSTKKLEETGFKCENGLEEMFDGAIKSCKEKGFL